MAGTAAAPQTIDDQTLKSLSNPNPRIAHSIITPPPPAPFIQPSFCPVALHCSDVDYQPPPPGVTVSAAPPQVPAIAPPYAAATQPIGCKPPRGHPHYSSPFVPLIGPAFPPRPMVGVMPPAHLPVVGNRGPTFYPGVRPLPIPSVTITEKPQTTVYIGKISVTAENDFMISLLQLCGPVKNWKRPLDPTGTLKGFGFCEFESAEGVLRAMRLLNKLHVDGQELMVNVNQTTREYLQRYIMEKIEISENIKESGIEGSEKGKLGTSGADINGTVKSSEESLNPSLDEGKQDDNKDIIDSANFGLETDQDREADREALEKLTGMIEERLRSKPLPPPPPATQTPFDGPGNLNLEQPSESRDWESDRDVAKINPEDKNIDEKTAKSKPSSKIDKMEPVSSYRSRRRDRRRDKDHATKREKKREAKRYAKEREKERANRKKGREYKSWEDERKYKAREKEWEAREREREHWHEREQEREKERAHERKLEVMDQECEDGDGCGKKKKYKTNDEEWKRRQKEKEEDSFERLREEIEMTEAKMRFVEEREKKLHEILNVISDQPANRHEKAVMPNEVDQTSKDKPSHGIYEGEGMLHNGSTAESVISSNAASDIRQSSNTTSRKLAFGLLGSARRATVPSVFIEEEDLCKEKKMRPLVPIDYSTEEQQAIQSSTSESLTAKVVAATYFVKQISTVSTKEVELDGEKEKSRRSHERSTTRDLHRYEGGICSNPKDRRNDIFNRKKTNKLKTPESPKLWDVKQLIDTIPKTKEELFTYKINWATYDQNALHKRMRPWISDKITDFLGEEEVALVDYIVSSLREHVRLADMLERLQIILDDEAEMLVLKMWRMLIFEIKEVETGIAPRSDA